ncbi:MAG TPA: hypothetical protein VNI54_01285 [Thermoanaerobaculia bacterium]|nr:hypothetical protein [Thermoanaerobaculia bacterium]
MILSAVLLTSTAIGQEEPLPPVTPRDAPVLIALALEPEHAPVPRLTLEDAARSNDYATFHQLYERDPHPAYAALNELWTYSVNDPIGAFYGADMYERFAARYPGFASYIDDHKIVDARGNVFYPTSETRTFLLARAAEGTIVTPREERVRVAAAPRPPRRARFRKAEATKPAAVVPKPEIVPAPAMQAAVVVEPPPPAPLQTAVAAASILPQVPDAPPPAQTELAGRGGLLIAIGVAGIGVLGLLLRTPREELNKAPHPR